MKYKTTEKKARNRKKEIRTRRISIVLVIVLLLSMPFTTYAASSVSNSVSLEGIMMSKETFSETYATTQKASIDKNIFTTCFLKMTEIVVSQTALNFNAELYLEDGASTSFGVSGSLYSGYKNQLTQMNSVIVDAESNVNGVSVLLFEMMFDIDSAVETADNDINELKTYNSSFMTTEPIVSDASIRLYIMIGDMIYMFEDTLPAIFNQCNNEYTQISDPTKDLLWFSSIISPTIEMEKTVETDELYPELNQNMSRASAQPVLWAGDTIYRYSFDVNGETYVQRSLPFGYYRICDVSTANSNWTGEFYISESTSVNGEKVTGIDNLIRYKNIQISMVAGESTQFANSEIAGQVKKASIFTSDYIVNVLSATVPWWDECASIVDAVSHLLDTGKTVKFGDEFQHLYSSNTTVIGVSVPYSKCELYNTSYSSTADNNVNITSSSHYLIVQAVVNSTLSNSVTSVATNGCIEFKWDVFINSTLEDIATNEKRTEPVPYTVTH